MIKSNTVAVGLGVLGVVLIIAAVLYAVGILQLFSSGSGNHYKHAILCVVLAVASFVGANFARPRTV
ncbi:MAG TPA: hypothetical protein VLK30_06795 [Candidatus Limnocylindrales bacterium]|nr:hypothetical protein [Candidatus Limnocylindrales bacterium]